MTSPAPVDSVLKTIGSTPLVRLQRLVAPGSADVVVNENAELKKKLEKFEAKHLETLGDELVKRAQHINGSVFIGDIVEVGSADALKKLCFDIRTKVSNYLIVLATKVDNKPHVAVLIDEKLSAEKNLEATRIIKDHIAPLIKGGGGGQRTLATAGGQDASKLSIVIETARKLL